MDSSSLGPKDAVDAQDEKTKSKSLNPLLCQQCQSWDNIWDFEAKRDALSLDSISRNVNCLICQTVTTSINARRGESESLRSWPASRILVRNDGPFFMDNGFYPHYSPYRVDFSDPEKTTIRMLMSLHISLLSDDLISSNKILLTIENPSSIDLLEVMDKTASSIAITPQFGLCYSTGDVTSLISIEAWEIPFFDVSLPRTWMQGCENLHGSQCVADGLRQISDLPSGFRVIDVRSMNIVKPIEPVRFVTLSYMWQQNQDDAHVQLEKENVEELGRAGGINSIPLPSIISDAISLCRELGESYLWIDQLCIVQDDAEAKLVQIRGMDKIYRSASFTITAALNSRDGGGIPGFGARARQSSIWAPPRDCEIEGRGIRPNGMEAVDSSLWNRRGWTFQERVLSKRRLFITEFQVIFECSNGQASEDFTHYVRPPSRSRQSVEESEHGRPIEEQEYNKIPGFTERSSSDSDDEGDPTNQTHVDIRSLLNYCDWVEDYTNRQLSRGSDILNAFAGVGNFLNESLGSRLIFGLPEKFLPQTLMWSYPGSPRRRTETPDIPTWSWASSLWPADYYWILDSSSFDKQSILYVASLVYFYYQDPDVGLRKLDVREQWLYDEMTIEEVVSAEELPELGGKYVPGVPRTNKTWRECPHSPWQTLAHLTLDPSAYKIAASIPGSLVFSTTVASLKLCAGPPDEENDEDSDEEVTASNVAIHNQEGVLVGWLNKMGNDWITTQDSEKLYDFIVLSGALADYKTRKIMAWYLKDFDMWRLNVMLIERLPLEPCVARRVEVGYIFAHKWKECNPRWETVVLA